MGIFDGIDAVRQSESVKKAAEQVLAVVDKRQLKQPDGRWSIADLQLGDEDVAWLLRWAKTLRPNSAEICLQWSSYSPTFGLLFMTVASEVCRRESDEASAFPAIRNLGWSAETKAVLFNSQGHISTPVCHAIDAACRRYDLRNVLDATDRCRWFTTIKLQFGMTRVGMNEQLHKWLYFHTLPSVAKILLNKDLPNYSASFDRLITSLDAFQDRFQGEAELRRTLRESPWILNHWIDDLVDVARQHPRPSGSKVGTTTAVSDFSVEIEDDVEHEGSDNFLSTPILKWNAHGAVSFCISVLPEIDDRCEEGRFFVAVDGENQGLFVRQAEGHFAKFGSSDREVELKADSASLTVSLCNSQSEPIAVSLMTLYDSERDVQAWVLGQSGFASVDVDTHQFVSSRCYTLCVPRDAKVEPMAAVAGQFVSRNRKWIRLAHNWPKDLRILLDEVEIFSGAAVAPVATEARWTKQVSVTPRDINWDANTLTLQISKPPECELIGVRVSGDPVCLRSQSSTSVKTQVLPIELNDRGQMDVRLCVKMNGARRILHHTPRPEFAGLLVHRDGTWQPHRHGDSINLGELRRKRCRVQAPAKGSDAYSESDRSWIAVQGNHSVSIPTDVGGWGQGLKFVFGKYNRPSYYLPQPLASKVIDRGAVLDCIRMNASSDILIRLQDPIEPSTEHQIIVWSDSGEVTAIGMQDIRTNHDAKHWSFNRYAGGLDFKGSIIAVGVAYRGTRIGAWWVDDWFDYLAHMIDAEDLTEIAMMLRWYRIPVLESPTLAAMQALVCKNAVAFASAWLSNHSGATPLDELDSTSVLTSLSLKMPSSDMAWYSVIRILFSSWEPSGDEASDLAEVLARQSEGPPGSIDSLVQRMAEAAPLLVGKLVRACLRNRKSLPVLKQVWLKSVVEEIKPPRHADGDWRPGGNDFDKRLKGLELSPQFVDNMLKTARDISNGYEVPVHDRENLRSLLQHPNFSRLVVANLLESIDPFEQEINVTT